VTEWLDPRSIILEVAGRGELLLATERIVGLAGVTEMEDRPVAEPVPESWTDWGLVESLSDTISWRTGFLWPPD